MQLNLSDVKKELFDSFEPLIREHSMISAISNFALKFNNKNWNAKLQFTENHWSDEVQLIPSICVDVKEINKIWKQYSNHIGYTYWMNLRKLEHWYQSKDWNDFEPDDKDKYIIKNNESDIRYASSDITKLFNNCGLKYILDFNSVEGVDFLMNSDFQNISHNWHCSGFNTQAIVGIIAAKLNSNFSYPEISKLYTSRIERYIKEESININDAVSFFEIKKYFG